jgi:acetyl esterase/lipase
MASREYQAALELFPKGLAIPGDTHEDVRRKFAPAHGHDPGPDIAVEEGRYGGVFGVWTAQKGEAAQGREAAAQRGGAERSAGPREDRVIFFVHGGAFVSCPAPTYTFYAAWLARAARARAWIVDYSLAPESRFPRQLEECVAAYRGLIREVDPSRIAFAGDSCGGGIALATCLRLRDAGLPLPACLVSLGGWFDLEASGESATHPVGEDRFVSPAWIRERGRDYLGPQGDPRDPHASPVHADLRGLPPLFLQVGQVDVTRDDAVRVAQRAGRGGTAVTLEIWPEMIHGFQGLQGFCPEAAAAIASASEFVSKHVPD